MLAVDSRHCVLIDRFGRALDAPEDANIVELHLSAPVHATFAVKNGHVDIARYLAAEHGVAKQPGNEFGSKCFELNPHAEPP